MTTMDDKLIVHIDGTTAYGTGTKAVFLQTTNNTGIFAAPDKEPSTITVKGKNDEMPRMVPWGENNDLPTVLTEKVGKLPQMAANLWFNVLLSYGDGIKPVRVTTKDGKQVIEPYTGNEEVKRFFEENDTQLYLLEQFTDMHWFFNCFPEIIFNGDDGERRKIVEIRSKEACFSRWSEMSAETGRIEWHYYFAYWGAKTPDDDKYPCVATPVLDFYAPIRHMRNIMEEDKGKSVKARRNRFIVPVTFPSPGRSYYQKPYWYSIIEGGLYDFAMKIFPFKDAIMKNKSFINYLVLLDPDYFKEIFRRESITDEKAQRKRMKKEYADIDKFLKNEENAGKSIITFQKKDPAGQPYPMIKIEVLKNDLQDGAYIEDSEEVSNIISYGMLVHPSLVGATPGKNKTINGTEARELFIIKQALMKPFRDRILRPFYLIKAINKWPDDLHFVIPNLELTTLDKDPTGSTTKTPDPNAVN